MTTGGLLLAPRKLSAKEQSARAELIQAGDDAFDKEDYERALECYHRASALDGSEPEIWAYLGLTYANLDFPREAWRSYKLALTADPEHTDSLWYAAEFLANMEDYLLSKLLLERYLVRETDSHQLSLARELLATVSQHVPASAEAGGKARAATAGDDDVLDDFDDEVDSLEDSLDNDDDSLLLDSEEEEFDVEDEFEASAEELDVEEEAFVASLNLQLAGMESTCSNCGTPIPLDAPYCYNCHTIHFYRD